MCAVVVFVVVVDAPFRFSVTDVVVLMVAQVAVPGRPFPHVGVAGLAVALVAITIKHRQATIA